jgi:hypothetical protein
VGYFEEYYSSVAKLFRRKEYSKGANEDQGDQVLSLLELGEINLNLLDLLVVGRSA